jgi:hypothetical protein
MHRYRFLPTLLFTAISAAGAQRTIDLTGKPAGMISEPFTKISGAVEVSPTLVVATDNMEAKVWLADFARGSLKLLGSKGRGPNEYQFPSPPIVTTTGAAVFDTYQKRAIFIDRTGVITSMKTLPDGSDLARVRGSDTNGRFYFEGAEFDPNTGRFTDSLPVVRWDPATNKVEPVARVYGGGRVVLKRSSGMASMAREITPFPDLDAWTPLPDGRLMLLRHKPFRIDITSGPRAVAVGDSIAVTPIPITEAERNWYRERNTPGRMGAQLAGGGTGPQSAAPQWEDAAFPATMPAFIGGDVMTSPEGEIWIPRSFSGADKTRRYDIYNADRRRVAIATLRSNARVVGFGPKSVYVARVNPDDDLVYLEKYSR